MPPHTVRPLRRLTVCLSLLAAALPAAEPSAAPASPALQRVQAHEIGLAARVAPAVVAVECRAGPRNVRYYGAGVVITPQGLILTALTAIPSGAREPRVRFADGREFPADVVCSNPETETVVLRLKTRAEAALPFLSLGHPEDLRVGDPVYAAGNPHETLRRDGQVFWSAGRLTGWYVARSEDETSRYHGEVLETDAAVNPGCDGGALVDDHGRLLGLLSLCVTRSRRLGTAVPLHRILAVLPKELMPAPDSGAATQTGAAGVTPAASRPTGGTPVAPQTQAAARAPLENPLSQSLASAVPEALRRAAAPAAAAVVSIHFRRAGGDSPAGSKSPPGQADPVTLGATSPAAPARRPEGPVTGVLVQPLGTVLTSACNVEGCDGPIEVLLSDGRRYRARLLGRHVDLDVALLQVEGVGGEVLPALTLSADAELRPGGFLAAVGAPPSPGAAATVSCGIVSALGRAEDLAVQTDAKTNWGNAGGPVVDLRGRLVGTVSQVGPRKVWGQSSGVGFFAPAGRTLAILEALRAGQVLRNPPQAFLGIAPAIGETDLEGVKLSAVVEGSAAWRAGLRPDDLLTALDGRPTRSWAAVIQILKGHAAGETLSVSGLRGPQPLELQVTLDARTP